MQAVIRADASTHIGSGHIMRCLVLADALRRQGVTPRFLCRELPGHLVPLLRERDYEVRLLPPHLSVEEDAACCLDALPRRVDFLITDHYAMDQQWEARLRPRAGVLMAIDDLANRPHDADLLLDQNLTGDSESRYATLVPPRCIQLLGPSFALLREEFQSVAPPLPRTRLQRLLISFGGGDVDNLTRRVLLEVAPLGLDADVVVGHSCPHLDDISRLCQDQNGRWRLHVQTPRMAEWMAQADLAIGAGGTTQLERCRMGLPALLVSVADNQTASCLAMAGRGACRFLGPSTALAPGAWRSALEDLLRHPEHLSQMSHAALGIMPDALGVQRVLNRLLPLARKDPP